METKRQRKNESHILAPRELLRLLILVTLLPKDYNQCDAQNFTSLDKSRFLNNLEECIEEVLVIKYHVAVFVLER